MSHRTKLLALAVSAWLMLPLSAKAQFTLQFGVTDAQAKRIVTRNRFTEPRIVKRSLTKVHVEACQDGIRYRLRLDPNGRLLERTEVGTCRRALTIEQAERVLMDRGYRRVDIQNQGGAYVAIACLDGERQRVAVSQFGDISVRRRLGQCQSVLSASDVTGLLRKQGYNRIKFTDSQLPKYVAEACIESRRVELIMNRFGKIRDQLQIGKCDPPINPADLPAILAKRGFDRVELTDDQLPRYKAEACRGADRVEVVVNRFGRIVDQIRLDRCQPPISRDELANALLKQGFKPVVVKAAANSSFDVNICRDGQRIFASFSKYGELLNQQDKGACEMPTLNAIADRFHDRGLTELDIFVEGCRNGRRVRIRLNEFGERIDRQRIGPC